MYVLPHCFLLCQTFVGFYGTCYVHFRSLGSSTANRHFLRAMARVGAGCEEFFDPKTKSRWERKVRGQLAKAFQPALTALSVEWQQFDDNAPKPVQVAKGLNLVQSKY